MNKMKVAERKEEERYFGSTTIQLINKRRKLNKKIFKSNNKKENI